jgi:excisionase family DNA binding protein
MAVRATPRATPRSTPSDYNARIELDTRDTDRESVDGVLDALSAYHASASASPAGQLQVILTVPAEDLRQAATTALALAASTGHEVLVLEVLPTEEFDRRVLLETVPDMISVTEAAAILDVSRQRVLMLLDEGRLPGTKVGSTWVLQRAAVEARAAQQAVRSLPEPAAAALRQVLSEAAPTVEAIAKAMQDVAGPQAEAVARAMQDIAAPQVEALRQSLRNAFRNR